MNLCTAYKKKERKEKEIKEQTIFAPSIDRILLMKLKI